MHDIAWDAQLWFPVVQRQLLRLDTDAADEEIHAAIVALIKQQLLVQVNPYLPYTWEPANSKEPANTDLSLRNISTSASSERSLNEALSSHRWVDEIATVIQAESQPSRELGFDNEVTYLESQIIIAVEALGWFSFLWFPIVDRDALNFGSKAPDDHVQRACLSLIQKDALVPIREEPGERPDWQPEQNAFKTAVYKALGRRI
jgi:hypothetical protein